MLAPCNECHQSHYLAAFLGKRGQVKTKRDSAELRQVPSPAVAGSGENKTGFSQLVWFGFTSSVKGFLLFCAFSAVSKQPALVHLGELT